ncbi:MAG: dockerin type I domain-containing protein [Chthoniobacterales bacterium]
MKSRWLLLPLVSLALSTSHAQSVAGFVHAKIQNFQQTSSAAPVLDAVQPFQFGSLLNQGTATINSATLTFSGTASPRTYTPVGTGDFSILDTFATQALLDASYGSGNYNLSANTSDGILTRTIFLFPFTYPTTPRLTVPAGDWQNNVLVINAALDYTFTWAAFANAQAPDLIQLAIRNSGVNLSPFPATQTSYTLPAGSLQPGTTYVCDLAYVRVAGTTAADPSFGAAFALLLKDTAFTIRTITPALALASAASRKTHLAEGDFDVVLPLSGSPGVECRTGGATGDHAIVFTFSNPIASGQATVTSGTGTVLGSPITSGNSVTVSLTGVANAQTIVVTLSNVTDTFAQVLPDTAVSASFLLGDTTGNGTVNATDVAQTKSQAGEVLTAANFRQDVNASGTFTSTDVALVKSSVGTMLPPAPPTAPSKQ